METPVFEENQPLYWPMLFLVPAILAAAIGVMQTPDDAPMNWIGFGFIVVAGVFATWGFRRMRTVVTRSELRFGFPVWRKRLPLAQVRVGEVRPVRPWYGIGIHWLGGSWIYNAHLGQAVEVQAGRTKYLIGSREPQKLQAALLAQAPRNVPV